MSNLAACCLPDWLCSLICMFFMRVCMSVNFNVVRNIRFTEYTWNTETQSCTYQERSFNVVDSYYQVPIYLSEFFLPALGGLVADKWFVELKLLRVAGVLLLLSGFYVTAVEMGQLMCHSVVYMLALAPSCLAYGVGVSSLVAAPIKVSHGHFGSPTPGVLLYFLSASVGELISFVPRFVRPWMNVIWIVSVSPLVYIAASLALRLDWTEYRRRVRHQLDGDGFVFPTKQRMLRYFLLLAPIVLYVSVIGDARCVSYCSEMSYYLNCTGNCTSVNCDNIFSWYHVSSLATVLLLCVLYQAGCLTSESAINARFYTGASALLLCRAGLIPWNCWAAAQPHHMSSTLVYSVYSWASALDGISEGLALASCYELMYRVAPATGKNLVMGLLFTTWGIGACLTGATGALLLAFPRGDPIAKPTVGQPNRMYISNVVMVIESAMLIAYYAGFSARLAQPLIPVDNCEEDDDDADKVVPTSSLNGITELTAASDSANGVAGYGTF